jgi:hypothetical protein
MRIDKRANRWATTACALLNSARTVLVAVRRLVVTASLLTGTITVWMSEVMPLSK